MSEYWVSKKKYFCKYCDIYIADDAPSRQHHESGLRHKGSVERFIRGIYKAGEKKKKDLEEEKREMARVEQAARAAFAQDISSGHAKASSAPVASTSSAPRKPAAKPSNPFANYSTADQLGFKDPDAEHLEIRKTQGLVGGWQVIESAPAPPPSEATLGEGIKPELGPGLGPDATIGGEPGGKRTADAPPEDDVRSFKLRRKTATAVLGEIYDPGLIPIKIKKREENPAAPDPSTSSAASSNTTSGTPVPKWTAISLKPKDSSSRTSPTPSSTIKKEEANDSPPLNNNPEQAPPAGLRWAKVQWGQAIDEGEAAAIPSQPAASADAVPNQESSQPPIKPEEGDVSIKTELDTPGPPAEPEQPTVGLFKKRKTPIGARGRR